MTSIKKKLGRTQSVNFMSFTSILLATPTVSVEPFKLSFSHSVSAAQDCKSLSCKRKTRQSLSLQASVGLFLCQKKSLASLLLTLRSTLLLPVHLFLPELLPACMLAFFPSLYLMILYTSWVYLPLCIRLRPQSSSVAAHSQ